MNPVPGNSYTSRSADTNNVTPGPSGANVNWNFASLILKPDSASGVFVNPASTPYYNRFPSATVATLMYGMYSYFYCSSSYMETMGNVSSNMVVTYTDRLRTFQYPWTYPNSFTDNFAHTDTLSGISVNVIKGVSIYTIDGWGSLTLPSGTVSNVMRVKKVTKDSTTVSGFTLITHRDTVWYWYKNNYKFPLLTITRGYSTTYGVTITTKYVTVVSNINVGIEKISSEIPEYFSLSQNYPNPFNPVTRIKFTIPQNRDVSIKIFDITGKELETIVNEKLSAGIYEIQWDASQYTSGTYFCRMTAGSYTETKKLLLIK
jgi:hypothetical protein